jgi:hypothetical protein
MTHNCNYELDLDGQVTCSICGAMEELKPDIWETQVSFEE